MSQLYARVFTQILDSSIAEDYTLRHIFEDLLKVCEFRTGVVDMTRQALSRRLNVPLELLNDCINRLESPDPASRDSDYEGRRIERLDSHRDWGWKILNWEKYERIRVKASGAERAARFRDRQKSEAITDEEEQVYTLYPKKRSKPDAIVSIKRAINQFGFELVMQKTMEFAKVRQDQDPQFTPYPTTWFNQHRFNDDPSTWKDRTHDKSFTSTGQRPVVDRNAGTLNAGRSKDYANVGKFLPVPDPERPATGEHGPGGKAV